MPIDFRSLVANMMKSWFRFLVFSLNWMSIPFSIVIILGHKTTRGGRLIFIGWKWQILLFFGIFLQRRIMFLQIINVNSNATFWNPLFSLMFLLQVSLFRIHFQYFWFSSSKKLLIKINVFISEKGGFSRWNLKNVNHADLSIQKRMMF